MRLIAESHSARALSWISGRPPNSTVAWLDILLRRFLRSSPGTIRTPKGTTADTREYSRRFDWQGNSVLKFISSIPANVATVSYSLIGCFRYNLKEILVA